MAKGGNGGGGGKPGGGGTSIAFVILGLDNASDSGSSQSDDLTNNSTSFTLTGTIDPSIGPFTLFINGDPYTITDIDPDTGEWSFTYTDTDPVLTDGTILVEASYTTIHPKNGKEQTESAPSYSFEIDTAAPGAPSLSETGGTLSGVAEAGAAINIYLDGVAFDTTSADAATGSWSIDLGGATGSFTAEAVDAAGNISALSGAVVVGGSSNTPASISGDAAGAVSEDGTLSDSGDPDAGEDALQAVTATGNNGYGSFDVQAGGNWTYTLTNSHADIQALAAGATLTDMITVTSADGTDTQVITVTITGTNDVPLITGDTTGGAA
jgi:VCBS repeat-containing protein